MKKLFLGIVVLLLISAVVLAGATWMISNSTEEVLHEVIAETNQTLESDFPFARLVYKSFEKGLVKSSAITELQLDDELSGQNLTLILKHNIYNGPVIMTEKGIKIGSAYIASTLDQQSLSADAKAIVDALFGGRVPFTTGMLTGTGDEVIVDMDIAAFVYDPKTFPQQTKSSQKQTGLSNGIAALNFGGMSASFSTDMAGSKGTGDFQLGQISVGESDGSKLTLTASHGKMNLQEVYRGNVLSGSLNYVIPEVVALIKGNSVLLTDVTVTSSTTDTGAGLKGDFVLDIASLQLPSGTGSEYSFPDSKLRMDVSIQGVDKESAKKLIDAASHLNRKQLMNIEADERTQEIINESLKKYFAALANTVKAGLTGHYHVDISNGSGISNLNLDITYTDSRDLFELETIRDLIEVLTTDVNINLSKAMLAGTAAEQAIAMPIAMGFATEKNDSYETIARLEKGELIVNGEVIPLIKMIGVAVNQPVPWELFSDVYQ